MIMKYQKLQKKHKIKLTVSILLFFNSFIFTKGLFYFLEVINQRYILQHNYIFWKLNV